MRSSLLRLAIMAWLIAASLLGRQEQQNPIRAGARLVVLPASVTDRHGRPIEGLSSPDFIVLDNGAPRPVQLDTDDSGLAPLALVTVIQTSDISLSALAKIRKVGTMIPDAVVGANGQSAVMTFDSQVKLLRDFTPAADEISKAFEALKPADNKGGRMIDAVDQSLSMLARRQRGTRGIIVIIGESRDRGSEGKLADLLAKVQNSGVTIYSLTYSAYLTPFTTKADEYTPPPDGGGILEAITETARLAKQNTVKELTDVTGGSRLSFQTKSKLENDLIQLGSEIHRRYYLSFAPKSDETPGYHHLEVQVKGHPEAVVRTRPGYWAGRID
jgi:VWFA-related protein